MRLESPAEMTTIVFPKEYDRKDKGGMTLVYLLVAVCLSALCYMQLILGEIFTPLLELVLIVSSISALQRGTINKNALVIAVVSLFYILYSFSVSVLVNGDNLLDFLQAYKSFYYLVLIAPFVGKNFYSREVIEFVFKFSLACFFIKYSLDKFALGEERPILMVENNFELVFLALLFYAYSISIKRLDLPFLFLVCCVFLLSGSRSSIVCLAVVVFFSINAEARVKYLLYLAATPVFFIFIYVVFTSRQGGDFSLEEVDRYKFMLEFLFSTKDWNLMDHMLGATPITPLDPVTCARLTFYGKLFSYDGGDTCYSVILHSFLLRVLYDHGVLGLLFLFSSVFFYLPKNSMKERFAVMLVLLSTSLSVSALNNVYVAISLAIMASSMFRDCLSYNEKIGCEKL